jgi:hypothetical protein
MAPNLQRLELPHNLQVSFFFAYVLDEPYNVEPENITQNLWLSPGMGPTDLAFPTLFPG